MMGGGEAAGTADRRSVTQGPEHDGRACSLHRPPTRPTEAL